MPNIEVSMLADPPKMKNAIIEMYDKCTLYERYETYLIQTKMIPVESQLASF